MRLLATRRYLQPVCVGALAVLLGLDGATVVRAETPACDTQNFTCGKAQVMAAQFESAQNAPIGGPLLEATADTDVLNVALDIEVSNLNTAGDTCVVSGSNAMTIKSKSPALTQFTFLLHGNYTITSLTETFNAVTNPASFTTTNTHVRTVTLNSPHGMDDVFTLTISYNGNSVDTPPFGTFNVATHAGTPVVSSLSEPYYSYTWWPCKDGDVALPGDNTDKFTTQLNITAPNNYVVPSNGVLQGVDALGGGRNRYRWASNYQIPAYLVMLSATNYNSWTKTYSFPSGPYNPAGSMPVQFFIYPENDTASNRTAWENCLNMLATYRTIYGEYPFVNEKYGIYNFNFGGGQEHQTMTGEGTFVEYVTAHELGHQWWGDNITCKTWSDIWVNEGFATYTQSLWEERKGGGINTTAYFNMLNSTRPSSNGANGSVYVYPSAITSGGVNRIFSSTYSYNKPAWVLHMLRHVVGDSVFFNGILPTYRTQFTGSAATTDDFANIAATVSGRNLTKFFDQWIYQRGAPTYQYGWQSVGVAGQNYLLVRVAQTQTATTGSPPQVQSVYEMPVDLKATIGGSPQVLIVQNNARTQWFVVPASGTVTALTFDNNNLDGAATPQPYILRGTASSVAYVAGPPKIVSTSPAPGAVILEVSSPSPLTVTFHTPINAAGSNFSLVGNNTGAQPLTLVSGTNVNPAVLNLAGPLAPDTYTLTVTSTGLTAVNSGMALDGEIANPTSPASLPSGDGVAGGNAVMQFSVAACTPTLLGCPGDIGPVNNDAGQCSAVVSWTPPTASGNCPAVTRSSDHDPGESFPVGMTTVTYTATDAANHTAQCSFTITVVNANPSPADIDQNCVRNDVDIDLFVQVLLGLDTDPGHLLRSDLNNSGAADGDDIGFFTGAFLAP